MCVWFTSERKVSAAMDRDFSYICIRRVGRDSFVRGMRGGGEEMRRLEVVWPDDFWSCWYFIRFENQRR